MLLILFGIPGVGKSHIGKLLQEEYGFFFYDADIDLTEDMILALAANQILTPEIRTPYYQKITSRIVDLSIKHPDIVVAQAFTKEQYRLMILDSLPKAKFVLIEANIELISYRLRTRGNHLVTKETAYKIMAQFDKPAIPHDVIRNEGGLDDLKAQFSPLLSKLK